MKATTRGDDQRRERISAALGIPGPGVVRSARRSGIDGRLALLTIVVINTIRSTFGYFLFAYIVELLISIGACTLCYGVQLDTYMGAALFIAVPVGVLWLGVVVILTVLNLLLVMAVSPSSNASQPCDTGAELQEGALPAEKRTAREWVRDIFWLLVVINAIAQFIRWLFGW